MFEFLALAALSLTATPEEPAAPAAEVRPDGSVAVVAIDDCEPATLVDRTKAFRAALAAQPGLKVQPESETVSALGEASRGSMQDAAAALKEAQAAFLKGSDAPAEGAVKKALEILGPLPPSPDRWDAIREGTTLLALLEDKKGRAEEAMSLIRRILRIDSGYQAQPSVCPPAFIQRVEAARSEIANGPHAELTVTTLPLGLAVFVSGVPVGPSPVHVKLPAGDYEVSVRWGSRRGLSKQAHVERNTSLLFDSAFEGSVYADAGPCIGTEGTADGRVSSLAQLGSVLGVGTVVGLREDTAPNGARRLVVLGVDVRTGRAIREGAIRAEGDIFAPEAVAQLTGFIAGAPGSAPLVQAIREKPDAPPVEKAAAPPKAAATVTVPAMTPADYRLRYASYGTAALATASLAVGIFFWIQGDQADQQIQTLYLPTVGAYAPGTEAQYGQYAAQENLDRNLAVTLWVVAGAAALTAIVLYVKSGGWAGKGGFAANPGDRSGFKVHF